MTTRIVAGIKLTKKHIREISKSPGQAHSRFTSSNQSLIPCNVIKLFLVKRRAFIPWKMAKNVTMVPRKGRRVIKEYSINPTTKAHLSCCVVSHSTLKSCHWTKKALKNGGHSYKRKFYWVSLMVVWNSVRQARINGDIS